MLRISLYGVAPLAGAGALLEITFESVGPAGSLTDLRVDAADLNEGAIPVSAVDGLYCVRGAPAEVASLALSRAPGSAVAQLTWDPHPLAQSYNVYRASLYAATDLGCLIPNVAMTSAPDDGAVPQVGRFFLYLVTAVGCGGDSIPGRRSGGDPIPNPAPCSS